MDKLIQMFCIDIKLITDDLEAILLKLNERQTKLEDEIKELKADNK